jgi:hypothetical protein
MKDKVIGFECYEVITEFTQPTFSVRQLTKDIMRPMLDKCKTQAEVLAMAKSYSTAQHLIWLQEVAHEIDSPHKELINKIIILT